jgi:hypothetical protein
VLHGPSLRRTGRKGKRGMAAATAYAAPGRPKESLSSGLSFCPIPRPLAPRATVYTP